MSIQSVKTTYIAALLLFAVFVFFGASVYIHFVQTNYSNATKNLISQDQKALMSLSELAVKGDADSEVATAITDCPSESRARFDTLLGELSKLKDRDLVDVGQLFNECGNFYPQRESVMYIKLNNAFQAYSEHITLLTLIDKRAHINDYKLEQWGKLIEMEGQHSVLSKKLVTIQGQIIVALQEHTAVSSTNMQTLLSQGQEVKNSLSLLSTQLDQLRKEVGTP